ncbi:MAG: ribonuclease P protein component [Christensenellaceae bacterium]|nr:ribonuclease P protein component [Christensenellaceae bacterium]
MQREYRLTNNASFNYIYKKGGSIATSIFSILFVKATSIKVGISVSRKIGKSVTRSLVKRWIREGFRLLIPDIKIKHNYVVVARPGIEKSNFHFIFNEMLRLLKKVRHLDG